MWLFFWLWDDLALLHALQSLPICYLWHFCLRLLTTDLVLSHILKTQEKSTVEIVNMVIWRRKVTEQREDMMILKGMLVWLRNKGIFSLLFSVPHGHSKLLQSRVIIPFSNSYQGKFMKIDKGLGRTVKSYRLTAFKTLMLSALTAFEEYSAVSQMQIWLLSVWSQVVRTVSEWKADGEASNLWLFLLYISFFSLLEVLCSC